MPRLQSSLRVNRHGTQDNLFVDPGPLRRAMATIADAALARETIVEARIKKAKIAHATRVLRPSL